MDFFHISNVCIDGPYVIIGRVPNFNGIINKSNGDVGAIGGKLCGIGLLATVIGGYDLQSPGIE